MIFYWHWEAMLVSYLSTRFIVLPFYSIAGLVNNDAYRLYVNPGTSNEDAFKLSADPVWQRAWTEKIEPYLEEYKMNKGYKKIALAKRDHTVAIYGNFFAVRYEITCKQH
jgi:hypothetical protein